MPYSFLTEVMLLLAKPNPLQTNRNFSYRIYSIKRRGAYLILAIFWCDAEFIFKIYIEINETANTTPTIWDKYLNSLFVSNISKKCC